MSLFRPTERRGAVATGSPTYNPFENPSTPLASVGLDFVYGRSNNDAGETVTVDKALTIPTVYRCVNLLSTVVASCPIILFKNPGKKRILQGSTFDLFDESNPNTTYTPYELFGQVVAARALWGQAYVMKKRDAYDRIVDLLPINPSIVKNKLDDQGNKIFLVQRDPDKKPDIYTTYEICHIPAMMTDGLNGLSQISLAAQTLGTSLAGDRLAAKFYSKGTQLGGIIKVKAPLTSLDQAEGVKSRWMARNAGVANAGEVAVFDAETDWQPITIPPDALQFLESRRWQTTELARMFGIPPHLVGDVEKSTSWGTGIEQQNIGFVTYTVSDYTVSMEQRFTREIVPTRSQYAKFDMTSLMRGDTTERFAAYHQAASSGWITGNEIRAMEDMEPLAHLNEPFISPNLIPMGLPEDLNPFAAAPPEPGAEPDNDSTSNGDTDSGNGDDDDKD